MKRYGVVGVFLALIVSCLFAFTASGSAPAPAPSACVYPTGSITQAKSLAYTRCRFDEQAAQIDSLRTPAPTVTVTATPSPTSTPTVTPTTTPPSPTATTSSPTATPTTPTSTPQVGFPNASNTGVPTGTALTAYTGPMTITTANTVIDSKTITGGLLIRATGVKVTNSRVNGYIDVSQNASLAITDSEVHRGDNNAGTGIEAYNYTALRVEITGGNRSAYCASTCTFRDSYVHGQYDDTGCRTRPDVTQCAHESGIRMEQNTTLIRNTIACDAAYIESPNPNYTAGCSAGLTGYGDFAPVQNNLIQGNLFPAANESGSSCAYGGSSGGKPYTSGARDIRFVDNVFGIAQSTQNGRKACGYFFTVDDFNASAPGNVFTGNKFTDGTPVNPS